VRIKDLDIEPIAPSDSIDVGQVFLELCEICGSNLPRLDFKWWLAFEANKGGIHIEIECSLGVIEHGDENHIMPSVTDP
jgi:hypothetical protein